MSMTTTAKTSESKRKYLDPNGNPPLTIESSFSPCTHVLIMCHGLGDTGNGWLSAMKIISSQFKTLKIILPTAPTIPVTLNHGYVMPAWYDISGLTASSRVDKQGLMASRDKIEAIIDDILTFDGVSSTEKIVIGGFSQGGAVALLSGLLSKRKLGGIIALSTYCPLQEEILNAGLSKEAKKTPLLYCHGKDDQVVHFKWGQMSYKFLKDDLALENSKFIEYDGMGHSSSMEELNDISSFLKTIIN